MTEESEIICVTCPKGCTLKVLHEGNEVVDVLGSGCKRGKEYAICELKDPRRMVASSVRVKNGIHPLLPVYTAAAFPKPLIAQLAKDLRQITLEAPVKINEVVWADAVGTCIDILASRDLPAS